MEGLHGGASCTGCVRVMCGEPNELKLGWTAINLELDGLGRYNFTSLGVRIPTLLISPWIPRGTVVSAPPPAQKPSPTSEYDLTSILATARKLLPGMAHLPPLTARDKWAGYRCAIHP